MSAIAKNSASSERPSTPEQSPFPAAAQEYLRVLYNSVGAQTVEQKISLHRLMTGEEQIHIYHDEHGVPPEMELRVLEHDLLENKGLIEVIHC